MRGISMDIFKEIINISAALASIISLIISFFTYNKVIEIKKNVNIIKVNKEFKVVESKEINQNINSINQSTINQVGGDSY